MVRHRGVVSTICVVAVTILTSHPPLAQGVATNGFLIRVFGYLMAPERSRTPMSL
jgi:hypothetical protein